MKILTVFALLFSTSLYGQEVASSYTCTHEDNDFVRKVKITHIVPGCEVTYVKADETNNKMGKVIFSAQNSTDYCDEKGSDFVAEKLEQKYGWICQDELKKYRFFSFLCILGILYF